MRRLLPLVLLALLITLTTGAGAQTNTVTADAYTVATAPATSSAPLDQPALTADASFDSWWPKVSPDRSRVLFYRTPKGIHD